MDATSSSTLHLPPPVFSYYTFFTLKSIVSNDIILKVGGGRWRWRIQLSGPSAPGAERSGAFMQWIYAVDKKVLREKF